MRFKQLHTVTLTVVALLLCSQQSQGSVPIGERVTARYDVHLSHLLPWIDEMEIAVLGTETHEGRPFTWLQFTAYEKGEHRWTCKMLVSDLSFMDGRRSPGPEVARYQFHEAGTQSLEYINAADGTPVLPALNFWRFMVPRSTERGTLDRHFFEKGLYLGREITRTETGDEPVDRIPSPRKLALRLNLYAGSTAVQSPESVSRLLESGATLFVIDEESAEALLSLLCDQPVFVAGLGRSEDYPQLLYRSNTFNGLLSLDWPGTEAVEAGATEGVESLYDAAQRVIGVDLYKLVGARRYSQGALRQRDNRWVFLSDPRQIEETRFPIRDAMAGAAWYQMEANPNGFVGVVRFRPEVFADRARGMLGVEFPTDAESLIRMHLALYRGAGEAFDRPWGVSMASELDPAARPLLFPLAWEAGASFFWFEADEEGEGVSVDEQSALLRAFADYRRDHPRPGLVKSKDHRVCIALPYGYTLDEQTLEWGALWNLERFRLDYGNETGTSYRDVLALALGEVVRCLKAGEDFDIAYWGGDQTLEGYREVRKVRADGTLFPTDRSKRSPGM